MSSEKTQEKDIRDSIADLAAETVARDNVRELVDRALERRVARLEGIARAYQRTRSVPPARVTESEPIRLRVRRLERVAKAHAIVASLPGRVHWPTLIGSIIGSVVLATMCFVLGKMGVPVPFCADFSAK